MLVDKAPLRRKAEQVADSLRKAESFVWVNAGQGGGRDVVLAELRTMIQPEPVVVRVAPLTSPDALAHARLQLAVLTRGADTGPLELLDGAEEDSLERSLGRVAERDGTLVLRMHPSWESSFPGEPTLTERAEGFLSQLRRAVRSVPLLRVLVLAGSRRLGPLRVLGMSAKKEFSLGVPQLAPGALEDHRAWGTLAVPFRTLVEAVGGARPTPLQLRLGVALVSLGDSPREVAQLLGLLSAQGGSQLEPLLRRLRPKVAHHERVHVLRRAAFARFALPWDDLVTAVPQLEEDEDLVRKGLGYETVDGRVRITEPVRDLLLEAGGRGEKLDESDLETHHRYGKVWERLDGALAPEVLSAAKVIPWLEKLHHRAHGGMHTREELMQLELPAREFYWDLGRALSREQDRFEDAALVYRRCWEKFGDDDYAHHYYAWNLDQAAASPKEVEEHFGRARSLRPDNVWWHSRLCTFLIRRARYRDAEAAFRQALVTLDPNEVQVREDAMLARSLHRWVIEGWLAVGEVDRAREVLDLIPEDVVSRDDALRMVAARVADAVEAVEIGESVNPSSLPPQSRWKLPPFVPVSENGKPLTAWSPGRVRRVDEHGVELVFVENPDQPEARELRGLELGTDEWLRCSGGRAAINDLFVIIASYAELGRRVFVWPDAMLEMPTLQSSDALDVLRYARTWLGLRDPSSS